MRIELSPTLIGRLIDRLEAIPLADWKWTYSGAPKYIERVVAPESLGLFSVSFDWHGKKNCWDLNVCDDKTAQTEYWRERSASDSVTPPFRWFWRTPHDRRLFDIARRVVRFKRQGQSHEEISSYLRFTDRLSDSLGKDKA